MDRDYIQLFKENKQGLAYATIVFLILTAVFTLFTYDVTNNVHQKIDIRGTPTDTQPPVGDDEILFQTELTAEQYSTLIKWLDYQYDEICDNETTRLALDAPIDHLDPSPLYQKLRNASYVQVDGHFYKVNKTTTINRLSIEIVVGIAAVFSLLVTVLVFVNEESR